MKTVLLSFDIEEFDMPFEYGKSISFEDQIKISAEGTRIILDTLLGLNVCATFFSTVVFAENVPDLVDRIKSEGHELASHGYFHSKFDQEDPLKSRLALQEISGEPVLGFRMPRMKYVDNKTLSEAGYHYNSSLNPIFLPGRYNNFFKPRTVFSQAGLLQIPASTTPILRVPLFWLSFHNLPLSFYKAACRFTMAHDNYLNIYFHPWEFVEIDRTEYGLPKYVTINSGHKMIERFIDLVQWMKKKDYQFSTISNFFLKRPMLN